MALRNMTLSDVDRLGLDADADRTALTMDEDAFRGFYDRTARALWAYLARATGDSAAADDLLQECYYRLLRVRVEFDGEAHRRHYLFRVATNLVRDRRRRPSPEQAFPEGFEDGGAAFPGSVGDVFWGGITGPRYFFDPKEKLVGIVFVQGPSIRAAYHAELRAMVYGALTTMEAK